MSTTDKLRGAIAPAGQQAAAEWISGFDAARQAPPPQPIEDAPF